MGYTHNPYVMDFIHINLAIVNIVQLILIINCTLKGHLIMKFCLRNWFDINSQHNGDLENISEIVNS